MEIRGKLRFPKLPEFDIYVKNTEGGHLCLIESENKHIQVINNLFSNNKNPIIQMKKFYLFAVLLLCAAPTLFAQDIAQLKGQKPVKLSSGVSLSSSFYTADGLSKKGAFFVNAQWQQTTSGEGKTWSELFGNSGMSFSF